MEGLADANGELRTALSYVTNPEDAPIIRGINAILAKIKGGPDA